MSDDQILSRLWMSKRLKEVSDDINSAVVLGSWYGVLPYILKRNNNIKEITAIDNEPGCIKVSEKINPDVRHIIEDCNKTDLRSYDCVINPSVNNIRGDEWYKNIQPTTLCLFQTEDVSVEKGCPKNIDELKAKYPLSNIKYEGVLQSEDRDGSVLRSMIIGHK